MYHSEISDLNTSERNPRGHSIPSKKRAEKFKKELYINTYQIRSYKTVEALTDIRNYRYLLNSNKKVLDSFCNTLYQSYIISLIELFLFANSSSGVYFSQSRHRQLQCQSYSWRFQVLFSKRAGDQLQQHFPIQSFVSIHQLARVSAGAAVYSVFLGLHGCSKPPF